MAGQVLLHGAEYGFSRFPAAAHLAKTDQPVVGLHFDDGPDEAPPVTSVGVTQRRLERHSHGCGPDVADPHFFVS